MKGIRKLVVIGAAVLLALTSTFLVAQAYSDTTPVAQVYFGGPF